MVRQRRFPIACFIPYRPFFSLSFLLLLLVAKSEKWIEWYASRSCVIECDDQNGYSQNTTVWGSGEYEFPNPEFANVGGIWRNGSGSL